MRKIWALLVGWLLIFSGQVLLAQNPKLIEAAKNEGGKVIVYTTMEPFTLDAIKAAFEKKTGLQVEFWRRDYRGAHPCVERTPCWKNHLRRHRNAGRSHAANG